MTTYKVFGKMTVSCWTEVEADSEKEAIAEAHRRGVAEHHIDGSYPEDECWHFDADGEPYDFRVEEE